MKQIIAFVVLAIVALGAYAITSQHSIFMENDNHNNNDPLNNEGGDPKYSNEWRAIDSLEVIGLTKDALERTEKLYSELKPLQAALPADFVRSVVYRSKFMQRLEEEGEIKSIKRFKEEMESIESPSLKAIFQSLLGEMYQKYWAVNSYKFSDRTDVTDDKTLGDDISTWTSQRLHRESAKLYLASVSNKELQRISMEKYYGITNEDMLEEKDFKTLRPTLYDFLAHRAIDYFKDTRSDVFNPSYLFELSQAEALGSSEGFVKHNFAGRDTLSDKYRVIRLLQDLIAFRLKDNNPAALLDADLMRLNYCHEHSTHPEKDALYEQTLESLRKANTGKPAEAEVVYYIALRLESKANGYLPRANEKQVHPNKWDRKKAHELFQSMAKKYPESYGGRRCEAYRKILETQSLTLQLERVNLPNQAMLANINYRNISKLYWRVYPVTEKERYNLNSKYGENFYKELYNLKAIKQWNTVTANDGDLHPHTTEFGLDGLPQGGYIVLVTNKADYGFKENDAHYFAYAYTQVSNLSFMQRSANGKADFYVTDRTTGNPLADVKAEFSVQEWNREGSKYNHKVIGEGKTDKNGYVEGKGTINNNFRVKFTKGKDVLFLEDNFYLYSNEPTHYDHEEATIFTDRAIYRPGQTVYFKGLVIVDNDGQPRKPLANSQRMVRFLDANYQEAAKLVLTTNEYGTFQGSFAAPSGGLTGNMQIQDAATGSAAMFNVEEYKRPKFEVNFDPAAGSFKLEDEVKVTGKAMAFAGSTIDGAKVKYRVVRTPRFNPWCWYKWGGYLPYNQSEQEINHGETTTDATGKYEITFKAIPDKSIPASEKPTFNYRIEVDVTDIAGETRSANTNINVGGIALEASLSIENEVNRDSLRSLKINTVNLNGEFEAAEGKILVEKLKSPSKPFKRRYWEAPDLNSMNEKDFRKQFPNIAFSGEDNIDNWPVEKKVEEFSFNTASFKEVRLQSQKWPLGVYKMTLRTKDKFGNEVVSVHIVTLYDLDNAQQLPRPEAIWSVNSKESVEPGDKFTVHYGSAFTNQQVLLEWVANDKVLNRKWINLNSTLQKSAEAATEQLRGGQLAMHITFIRDNRSYATQNVGYVPWSNKDLKIEYLTFRDKLQPGQDEEWRIKVSGPKGDKVAAEFLATMYDASLDAFANHGFDLHIHPSYSAMGDFGFDSGFGFVYGNTTGGMYNGEIGEREFPTFNWHGFEFGNNYRRRYYKKSAEKSARSKEEAPEMLYDSVQPSMSMAPPPPPAAPSVTYKWANGVEAEEGVELVGIDTKKGDVKQNQTNNGNPPVKVRTNLNETVFFFPQLQTDADGNVIIKFKMNEALTRWKFLGLAHTKELAFAITEKMVVTQKDLMVMPNAPRFLREGDEMEFSAKVSNLTSADMNGEATLELFDAITMEPIGEKFKLLNGNQSFTAKAGQSAPLTWKINIPTAFNSAVLYRIIARSGAFSDGEEAALPVLTNRMLVTETMPITVRGGQTKNYEFKRMKEVFKSPTQKAQKLKLEFTSNPAWYALQSLPYLMEYPYECTEQVFNRFYANALATDVANSHPKVKAVFDTWRNIQPQALKSNLEKNQDLKYALLEETPWVLASQNEEIQKKNIALLFDLNRMANEQASALKKISERQNGDGGFSWFPGYPSDAYITQYFAEGMGHMHKLGSKAFESNASAKDMAVKAVAYCDRKIVEMYNDIKKENLDKDNLNHWAAHYLYMRSFYMEDKAMEVSMSSETKTVFEYYFKQADKYWNVNKDRYLQGMLSLAAHRTGRKDLAGKIVNALRQNALNDEELGMYWKGNGGYYWYEMPIETHALMIEVFSEVTNDPKAVENLKIWLLKNKQTNQWATTKATAAACYALLLRGDNWLLDDQDVKLSFGNVPLNTSKLQKEAGTGQFSVTWQPADIWPTLADVKVENPNKATAWGALYYQYFEQLDKITSFRETPVKIKKALFKQVNTDNGPQLTAITSESPLQVGDLVKVRIEIVSDRAMEYVHLKDGRSSGFEPTNVLSGYRYQDGLGYYESTKDAASNFFISYLPKGTHVFEYSVRVSHKGDFSNGITTLQCMYAPEFTSHSEGIRVKVK